MYADAFGNNECETQCVSRLLAGLDRGACKDAVGAAAAATQEAAMATELQIVDVQLPRPRLAFALRGPLTESKQGSPKGSL